MNKFLSGIVVLISMILNILHTVNANQALIKAEIFQGIDPQRRFNIPGIPRSYSWEFENKFYTALMVIDEQWYNRIRNQLQKRSRDNRHFPPMVYKGVTSLEELIREFERVMPKTWSEERRVNFVLSFVQAIPYKKDETTGYDEFFKFATETLAEGQGDCEDTSILFAALLSGLGFKSALLDLPGHLAVGVKGDFKGWHYPYNNEKYFFCETASDNTRVKVGMMSEDYQNVRAKILPITPNPVPMKLVIPQTLPPKPKLPPPPSTQTVFEDGKNLYYEARYNVAIKSLQLALSGLTNLEQRAQVYIYLGAAELGFGKSITEVKDRFQEALRQNPNQELPWPNHQKFKPLFEDVRKKSIGELTISTSLPQTEIWIDGDEIDRKKLGVGTSRIKLKLFKGNYVVEGIYAEKSIKETIRIEPNAHQELDIVIPPFIDHQPVLNVSVGEIIPISISLTSNKRPNQVKIHYKIYDKNNQELGQYSKNMLLLRWQPALSIWNYGVNLPLQRIPGSIRYYIEVKYEGKLPVRDPKSRNRYYRISVVDDTPSPVNLPPKIVLINPVQSVEVDQKISIRAKVTDDISIKSVYLYYGFSHSRFSEPSNYNFRVLTKNTLDIYTCHISPQSDEGYIWYYITATDGGGNQNKPDKRIIKIKSHRPTPPPTPNQPPKIVLQNTILSSGVNQRIPIEAKVTDDGSVRSVYLHYKFSQSRFSEPSGYYRKTLMKNTSDRYIGYISPQSKIGYVWYYLTATDTQGKQSKTGNRSLEIKTRRPNPPSEDSGNPAITVGNEQIVRQEIWANYAWSSSVFENGSSVFGWNGGNAISLSYLRKNKGHQTIGVQLDYSYQNPLNVSGTFQWGSSLGKSSIMYILLSGFAGYRDFDSTGTSMTMNKHISDETLYFTPLLGVGLRLSPRDEVAIDFTGLVKLPAKFDTTFLYNYEMGVRIYIIDSLNLKLGFNQRYLSSRSITRIQIGFGYVF